jgi:hypothetical protein
MVNIKETPIGIPKRTGVKKATPFNPPHLFNLTKNLFFLENFLKVLGKLLTKKISIDFPKLKKK